MLGTREAIRLTMGAWLARNEDKPLLLIIGMPFGARQYIESLAKGIAQGLAQQGTKQGLAKAKDWYIREREALAKGELFDEPPTWEVDDEE